MQKQHVRLLFDSIAYRYDLLNHLLSGGIDLYWRRRAIETLRDFHPRRILDVATGTADLAIAASRLHPQGIIGIDIAEEMLRKGKAKVKERNLAGTITLLPGDAESLPFRDQSFDAAIVAFGARNFERLEAGLSEMRRVLRDGGRLLVMEFSIPPNPCMRRVYLAYFRYLLPWIGRTISHHREAYTYLPDTVMRFPQGKELLQIIGNSGFKDTCARSLTFGIVTIYAGSR